MRTPNELLVAAREKLTEKKSSTTHALSSKENFIRALEVNETAHGRSEERSFWKNEDLDLTPPSQWTWGWYDFAAFWWSYGFSVGVWSVGSSMVAMGLNSWQSIICVFISHLLGAIAIAWHSRIGSKWHFGFPVESRVMWGMYGSFFPIIIRLLVGQIWTSVLMMQGGYFLSILFRCIFGHAWSDLRNTIPKSVGVTNQQLAGFILYTIFTAPLLLLRPSHMRRLYTIKSFVLPPVAIGLFAFCIVQGKAATGSAGSFKTARPPLHGAALAWAMLSAINSCMGKTSSIAVNQTDLARYSRTPGAPVWSQLISLPIGNTLCAALGIFATSATQRAWGVTLWNPWDLCDEILDRHWNSGARTAIAFASMAWMLSIFASCMGVDVFPFGVDVTCFFPRWLNIRRGMYLCYAIGLLIFPWKILASSTTFLRFLGGYSIFLAPLVGIYITDYWVVRKGNIWVEDLYRAKKGAAYWYTGGVNWRNAVAFSVTVVLFIPGFAAQFGHDVGVGWEHLYSLGWIIGCTISSVLYAGLCMIGDFCKKERAMGFEESYDAQDMFFNTPVEGVGVEDSRDRAGDPKTAAQESKVTEL
ncbi:permease for cytosine/purines, uracil, thiamine, allantoin-domain-containing protein [Lophiotrema nucula]|uniref:Permease for cytosine/purines, uracil, thiamine, allantoin-domain-containing protein n=1 Tax=Lophiotrema nucula TaxID=690887 RepID=A0A6A5YVF0_9PLEO|nr:permease for cytosine/purines, uracil, thiamine, allantoin-domain-containing protein [Lophiotrema nucula]